VQIVIHSNIPDHMALMEAGYLSIVAGSALLRHVRARATGALAAVAGGLAIAGLRAAPGGAHDSAFAAVVAALLVLAALLAVGAAVDGWRANGSLTAGAAVLALAVGAGAMAWGGRELLAGAAVDRLLLALVVLSAAGVVPLCLGARLARAGLNADATPLRPRAAVATLLASGLAVLTGPHLSVVFVGVIAAAWGGHLLRRAAGGSGRPVAPALTLILLPVWWFLATVAGPEGLSMGGLGALPLSPAAERLVAPFLLLAAWAMAGLWPLQRGMPGPFTAPVGALLLARVALPTVPEGIAHWGALAVPLAVAGIWHAALTGRLTLLAIGIAWIGLLSPGAHGVEGAALLLGGALLLELARPFGESGPWRATAVRLAVGLATAYGALLAVEAGLTGEVVYTVVGVAGAVAAAGRSRTAQARTASVSSTVAPSA
jgi:hypothetical protein